MLSTEIDWLNLKGSPFQKSVFLILKIGFWQLIY